MNGIAEERLCAAAAEEGTPVSRGGKLLGLRERETIGSGVVVADGWGFCKIEVVGWRPSSSSQRWVEKLDACKRALIHSWVSCSLGALRVKVLEEVNIANA